MLEKIPATSTVVIRDIVRQVNAGKGKEIEPKSSILNLEHIVDDACQLVAARTLPKIDVDVLWLLVAPLRLRALLVVIIAVFLRCVRFLQMLEKNLLLIAGVYDTFSVISILQNLIAFNRVACSC